ncbi:MAG: VOC family protein, partial [Streptosporangiales bacterium]
TAYVPSARQLPPWPMTRTRRKRSTGAAPGAARPAGNRTVIIEFLVDDVDGVHQNLAGSVGDFVQEPTTMPWGNRSLLFRDSDGNLVNFFTPVTPAAIEKFAR